MTETCGPLWTLHCRALAVTKALAITVVAPTKIFAGRTNTAAPHPRGEAGPRWARGGRAPPPRRRGWVRGMEGVSSRDPFGPASCPLRHVVSSFPSAQRRLRAVVQPGPGTGTGGGPFPRAGTGWRGGIALSFAASPSFSPAGERWPLAPRPVSRGGRPAPSALPALRCGVMGVAVPAALCVGRGGLELTALCLFSFLLTLRTPVAVAALLSPGRRGGAPAAPHLSAAGWPLPGPRWGERPGRSSEPVRAAGGAAWPGIPWLPGGRGLLWDRAPARRFPAGARAVSGPSGASSGLIVVSELLGWNAVSCVSPQQLSNRKKTQPLSPFLVAVSWRDTSVFPRGPWAMQFLVLLFWISDLI